MTDSPRRGGPDPTEPMGGGYPGYSDPAYASQAYGPTYPASPPPQPTEQLPPYSAYGYDPYRTGQQGYEYPPTEPPEPDGPKIPGWLWMLAALVVLLVVGLVIALVITNSSRQETVFAPGPSATEPSYPMPSPPPTTTRRAPTTVLPPLPSPGPTTGPTATPPGGTTTPGATESVVYEVAGSGRAINITYIDTGGVLQTEFNVLLPWSKQVELPSPATSSASVSIINVGRDVTCTVTVDGTQIQQRTGSGLTICVGSG
ncbi:MmpS family transport accessory protein [Mycolicibacterium thermoresistibile]